MRSDARTKAPFGTVRYRLAGDFTAPVTQELPLQAVCYWPKDAFGVVVCSMTVRAIGLQPPQGGIR
jgi:hypothetical protein